MSSLTETIAVPLPQEAKLGQPKRAGPFWEYWQKTWWLYTVRGLLRLMAWGALLNALMALLSIPSVHSDVFMLVMNAHPAVMATTADHMSVWLFFGIAIVRRMVPAPINYMIGVRSIYVVEATVRKYGSRRAVRLMVWLMSQPGWVKFVSVFGLTIYSPPMPPMFPNAYTFAGATRMRFWWVMLADAAGTLVVVVGCYVIGNVFHPLEIIRGCF
jgi:hypothetical protein